MSIPFMLATGPLLGFYIGYWIDGLAGTGYIRFIMLFLGFIAGVRSVIRVLKEETPRPAFDADKDVINTADGGFSNPAEVSAGGGALLLGDEFSEKFEVDGEIIGLMHYSRRKTGGRGTSDSGSGGAPESSLAGTEHVKNGCENSNPSAAVGLTGRQTLLTLPGIVSVGIWTTLIVSVSVALTGQREIGAGILASGLWNLLNFCALWMVFKLVFSNNPYRIFFTLPVVCIKIPLLYFLVVELFRLNLFDRLGLTLGLAVLPAVFLFLALVNHRA